MGKRGIMVPSRDWGIDEVNSMTLSKVRRQPHLWLLFVVRLSHSGHEIGLDRGLGRTLALLRSTCGQRILLIRGRKSLLPRKIRVEDCSW